MTDPLDFDGLVEMGARAVLDLDLNADSESVIARAILTAVLPHVLAGPREGLRPFALIAEHDVRDTEADRDRFKPMFTFNRAPWIIIGDLRRARSELARIDKLTEGV